MPKVTRRSSRLKKTCGKMCDQLGCQYFAGKGKHCSYCERDGGSYMVKCNRYKFQVEKLVKKHAVTNAEFKALLEGTNGEVIPFLKNVAEVERSLPELGFAKIMFTAKQVEPLMKGYQMCSAPHLMHQKEATISVHDKILGRVLDHWNLGKSCFPGVLRCYWGYYGDFLTPTEFYAGRHKVVWSNENQDPGILKTLVYCARKGDNEPTPLRKMTVCLVLGQFKEL